MRVWGEIIRQLRSVRTSIILVWVTSFIVLSFVFFIHRWRDTPIWFLTSDPAQVAGIPPHVGFLSTLGLFFWSAAAALCFFSAALMPGGQRLGAFRRFLLCSGALTSLLLVDDSFLIHEVIVPIYLGIPETVLLASYGLLMLVYLLYFGHLIRQTDFVLLVMALGMFGFSMGIDLLFEEYFWEDGTKFMGIISWLAYFAHVSAASLRADFEHLKE